MKQKMLSAFACAAITLVALFGSFRSSNAANPTTTDLFEKNVEMLREQNEVTCLPSKEHYCRGALTEQTEAIILDFKKASANEEEQQ